MNDEPSPPDLRARATPQGPSHSWAPFILCLAFLAGAFAPPLWHLARFAVSSELYSYIVLIPAISAYMVWPKRGALTPGAQPAWVLAAAFSACGAAALAFYWLGGPSSGTWAPEDALSLTSSSFVCFLLATCCWHLGAGAMRSIAFPLGFLVFIVPMPEAVRSTVEGWLQQGSAAAAHAMFDLAGTPVYYNDLVFQLPNISLKVAPECSGIHSSMALLVTSVLAGYFFLRGNLNRTLLCLAVVPLAVLRNGFRIFVVGELCVHVGPQMIDSSIHHHGGPIFFSLSLIPQLLLLLLLTRSESSLASLNPKKNET